MIGFFSFVSRVLGLLRNRIFADRFGAGDEMDIYFAAFRVPDLVYNLFIVGVVAAVFIPVYFEYAKKDNKEALSLTNSILNIFVLAVIFASAIFYIFAPKIMGVLAYGFSAEKLQSTIELTRIMLLSPIFLGASSILGNFLQAQKKFIPFALAPVLYNLGIIFGALFLVAPFGVKGLAYGVVLGAIMHLLIQIPSALSSGFKYRFSFDFFHPGIKKMLLLSGPRVVGLFAYQANFMVVTAIGSALASGSIAVFNYANDLQYIPIGIIALAFVTAVFPSLSESYAKNDMKEFLGKFYSTVNQILYLVIPISVFLILERAQIVRVILGTGQFSWEDTRLTAAALGIFAVSVFAQSLVPLFSRAFFAMGNSKTPVFINVSSLIINIFLSFYFTHLLSSAGRFELAFADILKVGDLADISVLGLPLAFSLASVINLLWLYFSLSHKIKEYDSQSILYSINRINIAVFAMAVIVYPVLYFVSTIVDMQTFLGIFLQGIAGFGAGVFVYFLVSYILKIPEFFAFWEALTLPIKRLFLSKEYPTQVNGSEKL